MASGSMHANQTTTELGDASFETSASQAVCPTMRTLRPVSGDDVRTWMKYWKSISYIY
jgi:hypothetical protein